MRKIDIRADGLVKRVSNRPVVEIEYGLSARHVEFRACYIFGNEFVDTGVQPAFAGVTHRLVARPGCQTCRIGDVGVHR